MKTTDFISNKIKRLPAGYIFSYSDFLEQPDKKEAIIKALNRMVISGKLTKLAKGKYYKPEESVFGKLEPDQYQIVKDLLKAKGKTTGYITGYSIYNQLGLTTQVSNTIQIGKNDIRYQFKRGRYTVSYVKQKNEITKDNVHLLQILDAIRYIKKIPDASLSSSFERLSQIVQNLPADDKKKLVKLLFKYPSATRAITGAMLEMAGDTELAKELRKTLNPITVYKVPGIDRLPDNAKNWNLK